MNIFTTAYLESNFIKTNIESFKKQFFDEEIETLLSINYNELGVSITGISSDGDLFLKNISSKEYRNWKEKIDGITKRKSNKYSYDKICRNCKYFRRKQYHEVLGNKNKEQYGGICDLLLSTLQIENSEMIFIRELYIQDTFGCSFFKKYDKC